MAYLRTDAESCLVFCSLLFFTTSELAHAPRNTSKGQLRPKTFPRQFAARKSCWIGASNLRYSGVPHFTDPELSFVNTTTPGWTATADNVAKMIMEVEEKAPEMAAFLFNLLGNQLRACRAI